MMGTLYEIAELYRNVLDADCATDEEKSAIMTALYEIEDQFSNKVENCIKYIRNCRADAASIRAEVVALEKKARALENKAGSLVSYIEAMMILSQIHEVKAGTFIAKLAPARDPTITVTDESALPERYFVTTRAISRQAIRDAVRAGEDIPGVEVIPVERLVIK